MLVWSLVSGGSPAPPKPRWKEESSETTDVKMRWRRTGSRMGFTQLGYFMQVRSDDLPLAALAPQRHQRQHHCGPETSIEQLPGAPDVRETVPIMGNMVFWCVSAPRWPQCLSFSCPNLPSTPITQRYFLRSLPTPYSGSAQAVHPVLVQHDASAAAATTFARVSGVGDAMEEAAPILPRYLDKVVDFADGNSYELLKPLATYRSCHDGTPAEARIVLTCRRLNENSSSEDEYVMKIKIQIPGGERRPSNSPELGPSTTTAHELKALERFQDTHSAFTPVLVNFKKAVQPAEGPLPGGYLTFLVMTKMPGDSLFNMYYWGMTTEERNEISQKFLVALKWIYAQGIEPVDCGLRNILWERDTKKCSIIDFELWRETDASGYHFASHPAFRPNKSPLDILQEGAFGGSFFAPWHSRTLGLTLADDHLATLPAGWLATLQPAEKYITAARYEATLNRHGRACGQTLAQWEAAGWLDFRHDPRGWFEWYIRFWLGRRLDDGEDERQVGRWLSVFDDGGGDDDDPGAGDDQHESTVSPVIHQTCLQWGYQVTQEDLDDATKSSKRANQTLAYWFSVSMKTSEKNDEKSRH
ncbi:hypothetical protein CLAIMM_13243 [Cladophialophora immunda]|nr:hypothetical protein CLAIMM_13243 [Cladophialophora immunda]